MALFLLVGVPATSAAQVIGGQAVEASSGAALAGIPVFIQRTDKERPVLIAEATSDRRGFFQFAVATAGSYRLLFGDTARPISVGPDLPVDADSVVLRQYAVPLASHAFLEQEVELAAMPLPKQKGPMNPAELRQRGIGGEVLLSFVVDTTGRVEPASLTVQCATAPEFESTVRDYVLHLRFVAAKWHGFTVRQVLQQPFEFAVHGGPEAPRGPETRCPRARVEGASRPASQREPAFPM
jgi:TonB family protein